MDGLLHAFLKDCKNAYIRRYSSWCCRVTYVDWYIAWKMLNEYLLYRGIYADVVGGEIWTGWFLSSLLVLRFFDFQNHLLEKKMVYLKKCKKEERPWNPVCHSPKC